MQEQFALANDRSNEITPADVPAYGPGNIWLDTIERRSDAITARGIAFQPSHHRVPGISAHLLVPYRTRLFKRRFDITPRRYREG
jgi:hypothetical protein